MKYHSVSLFQMSIADVDFQKVTEGDVCISPTWDLQLVAVIRSLKSERNEAQAKK